MNKTEKSIFVHFDERKQAVKSETLEDEYTKLEQQKTSAEAINMLTDADMPNIDTLNEDSDYSMFMSANVSEALKRKALRKLFLSPSINILDGMNDYDENYTTFELLGNIIPYDLKQKLKQESKETVEKTIEEKQEISEESLAEKQEEVSEEGLAPKINEIKITDNNLTSQNDKH